MKNKTALMKATELLARQEQSSATLRRKLLLRKYDAAEVDEAIDKLKRYNYLDDEETCRRQFEILWSDGKLSVRQIVAKLIQRGFEQNFIEQLIPADTDEHELNAATYLLTKKFTSADVNKNFNETLEQGDDSSSQDGNTNRMQRHVALRAKAWQFLSGRGFDGEIISTAVENFTTE